MADRMFHSMRSAWESASRENMSDVRELTPEFFYLPEFLTNCNAVEFGERAAAGPRRAGPPHRSGLRQIFAEQLKLPLSRPMRWVRGRHWVAAPSEKAGAEGRCWARTARSPGPPVTLPGLRR